MIIFLFCQEIRVLRFWSFTFLEVKILKLGFFAQIKKWSWDNFKFQSIIMDILWGFHQKMGEEGGMWFFWALKNPLFSAKFQIWKNLWIQKFFLSWISTNLYLDDTLQKEFPFHKPKDPERFFSFCLKIPILRLKTWTSPQDHNFAHRSKLYMAGSTSE